MVSAAKEEPRCLHKPCNSEATHYVLVQYQF